MAASGPVALFTAGAGGRLPSDSELDSSACSASCGRSVDVGVVPATWVSSDAPVQPPVLLLAPVSENGSVSTSDPASGTCGGPSRDNVCILPRMRAKRACERLPIATADLLEWRASGTPPWGGALHYRGVGVHHWTR